jgi:hypothetical protein
MDGWMRWMRSPTMPCPWRQERQARAVSTRSRWSCASLARLERHRHSHGGGRGGRGGASRRRSFLLSAQRQLSGSRGRLWQAKEEGDRLRVSRRWITGWRACGQGTSFDGKVSRRLGLWLVEDLRRSWLAGHGIKVLTACAAGAFGRFRSGRPCCRLV